MTNFSLPWTAIGNSWQYTSIYNSSRHVVCRLDLEDWSVNEENQDELEKVQAETAALIVTAVNSHDRLMADLAEAVRLLDALLGLEKGSGQAALAFIERINGAVEGGGQP